MVKLNQSEKARRFDSGVKLLLKDIESAEKAKDAKDSTGSSYWLLYGYRMALACFGLNTETAKNI